MSNQLDMNNPILDNQPEARQAAEADARAARVAADIVADNGRRGRIVDFVARERAQGPAFTDGAWSPGFMCCFLLWVFVTFGGMLAFIIPAGIYSVRFLASTRPQTVPAYNSAVDAWVNSGFPNAKSFASSYQFGVNSLSGMRNFASTQGAPTNLVNSVVGELPLITDGEMTNYPASIIWSSTAQVVPDSTPYSGSVMSGNFSLFMIDRASGNVVSTTELIQVPVVFKVSVGSNCAGSVTGDGCVCPDGTSLNSASRKCEGYAFLRSICLVATVDTSSGVPQLKLATDTSVGAGCAIGPYVTASGSSSSTPVWVPVPQLDACVPTSINNVAPFSYSITDKQPSRVNSGTVPVYVRAVGDPYVTALSVTGVMFSPSGGSVYFGTPAGSLESVAAGTWFGFTVCFLSASMYMLCVCTTIFDAPLNSMATARNCTTPVAMGIGAAVGTSRGSKCCRKAVESGFLAICTAVFLTTLVAYSYLAFVLLDVSIRAWIVDSGVLSTCISRI